MSRMSRSSEILRMFEAKDPYSGLLDPQDLKISNKYYKDVMGVVKQYLDSGSDYTEYNVYMSAVTDILEEINEHTLIKDFKNILDFKYVSMFDKMSKVADGLKDYDVVVYCAYKLINSIKSIPKDKLEKMNSKIDDIFNPKKVFTVNKEEFTVDDMADLIQLGLDGWMGSKLPYEDVYTQVISKIDSYPVDESDKDYLKDAWNTFIIKSKLDKKFIVKL